MLISLCICYDDDDEEVVTFSFCKIWRKMIDIFGAKDLKSAINFLKFFFFINEKKMAWLVSESLSVNAISTVSFVVFIMAITVETYLYSIGFGSISAQW